jgi:hypothetical protein
MASLNANPKYPNDTGYQTRHNTAIANPRPGLEKAMVDMLKAWTAYALAYESKFDSQIGGDGVLGEDWLDIGKGIRGLLNGDCGPRLDMGTLDSYIIDTLKENGMDTSNL